MYCLLYRKLLSLLKGEGKPYRLRIRSGAFYNLQIFPELIRGRTIADAVVLLGSLDPVVGETDR